VSAAAAPAPRRRWAQAWPDALAFAGGLVLAWRGDWETGDLIWSLWLSSLVVGYALIVWSLTVPLRELRREMAGDVPPLANPGAKLATIGITIVGTLFGLAFFTVHFGGFHYVHSVFLNAFFPVTDGRGFPGANVYRIVFSRYWIFLPLAFLAERAAFRNVDAADKRKDDLAVTPEAIDQRKARNNNSALMTPYKGVVRMHLLIFFFAFAHFAHLENFFVYAVVYAVYFFPWRLLRKEDEALGA
jgi:hypothetical protein